MKITLPKPIKRLFIILLLFTGNEAYATHIVGLELRYTFVSGNTYNITLVVYGDCGPASSSAFSTLPTAAPQVCIYDGNTSISSVALAIQPPSAGVEITPVCPADINLTQCTNTSYVIPGIKKFVYTGTYVVPYTSPTWRFIFTGSMGGGNLAGRAAAITNITAGTTIQIEDTLNNTVYNNSNAVMTTVPTPFFCLGHNDSYNPGAVDPDGDSLSFFLVPGALGSGTCTLTGSQVTYTGAYSGSAPLGVVPGTFTFDQHTGQISFLPNVLQRALVVYNVEEYRGGTFVGSSQREMTFLVLTCTDIPPSGGFTSTTAGTIGDSTHFYICVDSGAFALNINPVEADTSNTITVTASGLPAGALFNVVNNGTNHPICTFSWNTTGLTPGSYIYYLTFADNACPLSGSLTQAFTIIILPLPKIIATGGLISCTSPPATLAATGGISYSWTPAADLPCPTCDSNLVNKLPFTTLFTVRGVDGYGCKNTDTASIIVIPSPANMLHDITHDQVIAYGTSIQLSVQGAVYYYWTPDNGTLSNPNINNPTATPLDKTTYIVYGYDSTGCVDSQEVTIDVITTKEVVPTAFTPNGDNINDVFRVANLNKGHLVDMKIFNRWGELVCQTSDNNKGWDGKFEGIRQDIGTYFYTIIIEHEDHTKVYYKGDLTLVR